MPAMTELFVPYIAKSTNAMYAGQHWSERKRHKNSAGMAVAVALSNVKPKILLPVDIEVYPILGKGVRTYDVSNYSYTYKLIEDCLVSRGVIVDDTPKYVNSVKFCAPVRSDTTGIKLVIKTISTIAK